MYSRNQSRGYTDDDYDDDEMTEEYQLYAYNLPPNYDGSRFRRYTQRKPPSPKPTPADHCEETNTTPSEKDIPDNQTESPGGAEWLLEAISKRIGCEELLIISLILILAAENDRSDTLLLLTLLLLVD